MRARSTAVATVITTFALLATTGSAATSSTPEHDVENALKEGSYTFCSRPPFLPTPSALALCPLARETPGCEAFVAVCDRAKEEKKPEKNDTFSFLGKLRDLVRAFAVVGFWLLVAGVVVIVALPIVQAILRARRDRAVADDATPDAAPAEAQITLAVEPDTSSADALLQRANDTARGGDGERALGLYLAAALRALDQRGAVRIAKDRTNGEYVRGCKDPAARTPLREIVVEVDRVQFGGAVVTPDAVARAASRATALVRNAALAALIVGMAFLAGCGGPKASRASGTDPAGDELVMDLLRRQGAQATRLTSALASLPLPKADDKTQVVVLDMTRIEIEEEAAEHLVAWTEAGGVLVLLGHPSAWPEKLKVKSLTAESNDVVVDDSNANDDDGVENKNENKNENDDQPDSETSHETRPRKPAPSIAARVALPQALEVPGDGHPVARFKGTERAYAYTQRHGTGMVLGVATPDLFTNIGVARPGNATAVVTLLGWLDARDFRFAREEDGISPPSNPIAGLHRAGLGLGLWHALAAVAVLFIGVGIRMTRPMPIPPPARRAFAEHVEATGAFYARTRAARHALAVYARYADELLRARMPRGASDVAAFLSARTGRDAAACAAVWDRAMAARDATSGVPLGAGEANDLLLLKELRALVVAATSRES